MKQFTSTPDQFLEKIQTERFKLYAQEKLFGKPALCND